ncbi:MAG: hypothetical protein KUL88_18695 [Rhizobium sp.]|nr:hypothetical protein [Rhizobium sp.]
MLPPVNAVANSSVAFQDPRAAQDGGSETHARPQGALPQAANALEQNSAIAGRLNLLMLTGQQRMSDNLVILVNLLGSRLGIERNEGETLNAYAGRLVQALGDLPPQMRQSVQRQLAQMFGGLQLRTSMEAFRNPAGPEAATLSIYLELYRIKDKDLAARTVVTSYRQNAAEARTNTVAPAQIPIGRAAAGSSPALAAAAPPAAVQRSENGVAILLDPQNAEGDALDDPMAPVAKGRLFGMQDEHSRKMLKVAAARALQATMSFGAEPASRNPEIETAVTEARGASKSAEAVGDDRPRLETSSVGEAGAAEAPVSRTKGEVREAIVRHLTGAEPPPGENSPHEARGAGIDSRTEKPVLAAARPVASEVDEPREADDKTQTLFVLKGWQEDGARDGDATAQAPLATPEDIQPHPARLIGLASPGDTATESRSAALPVEAERLGAVTEQGPSTLDRDAEAFEQLEEPAVNDGGVERAMAELGDASKTLPDAETAHLRQSVVGREGIPLPLVNYLFADDDIAEQKGLKHRFSREGEAGGEDAEGFGAQGEGEGDQGEREDETAGEGAGQDSLAEDAEQDPPAEPVAGETPNDLYWRMAGWS